MRQQVYHPSPPQKRERLKNINREFTFSTTANVSSVTALSHTVSRGSLKNSDKIWIKKEAENPASARLETLAQEFFRLIISHQPETRHLVDPDNGVHYVLSEEIKKYTALPINKAENFINGTYTGLGQAIVAALYLQETDLKNGNIGLDSKNRVAKIDGDRCFMSKRRSNRDFDLTAETINNLPYPEDFYCNHWLDIVTYGKKDSPSEIVNPSIINAPQFRQEVNQAIIKISLLPDSFIDSFVDAYMPAGGTIFANLMKERREELFSSAMTNSSFKAYLKSDQAMFDTVNLISQMNSFKANGDELVMPIEDHAAMELEVRERLATLIFEQIRSETAEISLEDLQDKVKTNVAQRIEKAKILINIETLLDKILLCKVNSEDILLAQHVDTVKQRLISNDLNLNQVIEIHKELNDILISVSSNEVKAVIKTAEDLKATSYWYSISTIGNDAKAKLIEKALCATKIQDRGTVITQKGPANAVQEALASHRFLGYGGTTYKNGAMIDVEKAAKSYTNLMTFFSLKSAPEVLNKSEPTIGPQLDF